MPDKLSGCGCCTPCCIEIKNLAFDVSVTGLPSITEGISYINEECSAGTTGYFEEVLQAAAGYIRPITRIPFGPTAALNMTPTGGWTLHQYYEGTSLAHYPDVPDAMADGCYKYSGTDMWLSDGAVTGSVSLILGNEPDHWPYWINVRHRVYVDEFGDCILRIGATLKGRASALATQPIDVTIGFGFNQSVTPTTSLFAATDAEYVEAYSCYHPCYEDDWGSPITCPYNDFGAMRYRTYTSLVAQPWDEFGFHAWLVPQGLSPWRTSATWAIGELSQLDDSDYIDHVGLGLMATTPTMCWEVNLTTSLVTDLASLPPLSLDWSNIAGITDETYVGDPFFGPLVSPSVGWETDPWIEKYTPASYTLSSSYIIDQSTLYNLPTGSHVCSIGPTVGDPCVNRVDRDDPYGTVTLYYVKDSVLQKDLVAWEVHGKTVATVTAITASAISLTVKPPTP